MLLQITDFHSIWRQYDIENFQNILFLIFTSCLRCSFDRLLMTTHARQSLKVILLVHTSVNLSGELVPHVEKREWKC